MSINSELKKLGCPPEIIGKLVIANKTFQRIKGSRLWEEWLVVGHAIDDAHEDMMKRLGLNVDNGAAHNIPWGQILRASGFDEIAKQDRDALRECLKNLDAITQWRDAMDPVARSRHNHPRRVLEHWRKDVETARQAALDPFAELDGDEIEGDDGGAFGKRRGRRSGRGDQREIELQLQLDAAYQQIELQKEMIAMLKARIAELEARLAELVGNPAAIAAAPLPH